MFDTKILNQKLRLTIMEASDNVNFIELNPVLGRFLRILIFSKYSKVPSFIFWKVLVEV